MPTYEYENAAGERREIVAPMKDAPPAFVLFGTDGTWEACPTFNGVPVPFLRSAEDTTAKASAAIFRRVYTMPAIAIGRGSEVHHAHQPIPQASISLPRTQEQGEIVSRHGHLVRKLKNGAHATLDGRRICDSSKARDAHLRETGCVSDD
jgi:hypothetical protein